MCTRIYAYIYKLYLQVSVSHSWNGGFPLRSLGITLALNAGRLLGKIRQPAPRNAKRNARCAMGQSRLHLGLLGLTSFGRPRKQGGTGGTGVTCLLPQEGVYAAPENGTTLIRRMASDPKPPFKMYLVASTRIQ